VFLTSEALRALDERQLSQWDWSATTILWISYDWDPVRGGRAESLAGRRLAAALLGAGAGVHVLTAGGVDQELRCRNYDATVIPTSPLSENKVGRALQMVRCGIPEGAGLWVSSAVDAGVRVLASLPADTVIYGRAMPGSSNIVAWHLARLTGLSWVAHFSDDWPPVQVLANGRKWLAPYKWPLFRFWRRRILADAGALTFTNPHQASAVLGAGGERHLAKSFVVTHLGSAAPRNVPQQHELFHIVHTGNFYPPGHTSAAVIQGLRLFVDRTPAARKRCRFTQAGWANGDMPEWTARCGLGDIVRFTGRLQQHEVIALLDAANLLIAVDYARPNSSTVLSKLPDYVNARRPILAVAAPSSAMGRLFHEDSVGATAHYDSPDQVAARIGAVFEAWQQGRSDVFLPQPTAMESFAGRRVLTELAGAFLVAQRRCAAAAKPSRDQIALREGQIAS
jgi:hypothetical protein